MENQISVTADCVRVKAVGRMNSEAAEALGQELMKNIAKGYKAYIIDVSELVSISSAGIGMLIAFNKSVRAIEGSMTITGVKGHIKDLFEITLMNRLFKIEE